MHESLPQHAHAFRCGDGTDQARASLVSSFCYKNVSGAYTFVRLRGFCTQRILDDWDSEMLRTRARAIGIEARGAISSVSG